MLSEEVLRKRRALVVITLSVRLGRIARVVWREEGHIEEKGFVRISLSIKRTASLANWVLEKASALRLRDSVSPHCNPAPGSQSGQPCHPCRQNAPSENPIFKVLSPLCHLPMMKGS